MSLPANNRRKSMNVAHLEKNKFTAKRNETKNGMHDELEADEYMDTVKKSDASVSMKDANLKSDTDKTLYAEAQEKATGEPYVHEFKEFPGVTIIFRTAANPKAFEKLESHAKVGMQSSRRKPEFEHGDKTDHTGVNAPLFAAKSDVSANNSNDTSSGNNQH